MIVIRNKRFFITKKRGSRLPYRNYNTQSGEITSPRQKIIESKLVKIADFLNRDLEITTFIVDDTQIYKPKYIPIKSMYLAYLYIEGSICKMVFIYDIDEKPCL